MTIDDKSRHCKTFVFGIYKLIFLQWPWALVCGSAIFWWKTKVRPTIDETSSVNYLPSACCQWHWTQPPFSIKSPLISFATLFQRKFASLGCHCHFNVLYLSWRNHIDDTNLKTTHFCVVFFALSTTSDPNLWDDLDQLILIIIIKIITINQRSQSKWS